MMRAEWYLTAWLCANSIPLPPRGHEIAVDSLCGSLAGAGLRQ
jgi:hypothetical protein